MSKNSYGVPTGQVLQERCPRCLKWHTMPFYRDQNGNEYLNCPHCGFSFYLDDMSILSRPPCCLGH